MWIDKVLTSRTTEAVKLAAIFSEERHRVLAKNVANVDTPDYHTQRLDPQAFQKSLRKAIEQSKRQRKNRLQLSDNAQFATSAQGAVNVRPDTEPAANVLFHDGTNARLERLLSETAQNQLTHGLATKLLAGRFSSLMAAIRGKP
jgi:flagellar basal-body rod protein FlgB